MKELKDYTDDELREELKRRIKERRKSMKYEVKYVEFEATIKNIDNVAWSWNGQTKLKPFSLWTYRLTDCSLELGSKCSCSDYKLNLQFFKKSTAPKVGDRVLLKYRETKYGSPLSNIRRAKIIKVL